MDDAQLRLESALLMLKKRADPSEGEDPSNGKEAPSEKETPTEIIVEMNDKNPTPVKPEQKVSIGNTGSTIKMPKELPEKVSITVKKVSKENEKVKNTTEIRNNRRYLHD